MSSDDSATFLESESASIMHMQEDSNLDELYKHIPPPIPLIPKNKYKETSRFLNIKYSKDVNRSDEGFEKSKKKLKNSFDMSDLYDRENMITLTSICESSNIVYLRDPSKAGNPSFSNKVKLDNLSNLPKFEVKSNELKKKDGISFESRFECGNLAIAVKKAEFEYDLLMQNDINTKGHTQWFYFKVQNTSKDSIKFNILNFAKKDSLYNYGMKVLVNSEKNLLQNGIDWHHTCREISYYANNILRNAKGSCYYTLTFTYDFLFESDTVYFAYSYPYTYTELLKDLEQIESKNQEIVRRKVLCLSITDKFCEVLTITAPGSSEEIKKRKGAVISARVHPGETVGSWMMKGLLEFLVSGHKEAKILREKYVFQVIPMLNPDGVFFGNYRCGLAGSDLNRSWKCPSKILHPTIYAAKKLIKAFNKERIVDFICDFHGHSKKKNIFMYGCNLVDSPEVTRTIPFILSKISAYFCYPYCSFRMQKSKEATLRISIFKETKIPLIYTLEASFFGGDYGEFKDKHYSRENLKEMGKQVCLALLIYNDVDILKEDTVSEEIYSKARILEELMQHKELLEDPSEDSSGSDSDPSEDNLQEKELEGVINFTPSNKHLQQKKRMLEDLNKRNSISINKREPSARILSVPRKIKCNICGEIMNPGHSCLNKPKPLNKLYSNSRSATLVYLNPNGKKVRDQATQTIKLEESKTVSPHESFRINKTKLSRAFHSNTRNNVSDDISSIGRLWKNKQLPNLKKIK